VRRRYAAGPHADGWPGRPAFSSCPSTSASISRIDRPPDQLPEEVRARLSEATMKMREQLIGFANAAVITELRLIVENGRG
jgi:hypothetical protein